MNDEEYAILKAVALHPHKLGHIVGMSDLSDLHSVWMQYCWNSDMHRFLQAHRGGFKTSAITILGPVYHLLFNPEETISICRKTQSEAIDTLGAIKKIFENEDIQELFKMAHGKPPARTIDRGTRIAFDFKTSITKEGSIDVYGTGSSLTGTHYGKMILDDIVTLKDRLSRAEREGTKEFLREVITNIINPGKQVIHVGTPWHKDDAWSLFDGSTKESMVYPIQKYDVYNTGLRTEEWILQQRKLTTPSLWAANYELTHQADDRALFKDPKYQQWINSPMKAKAHLDAAFGGDCYSAFTIGRYISIIDKRIQIIGRAWDGHIRYHYIELVELCMRYNVDELWIETNADKGFTAEAIRNVISEMGAKIIVKDYTETRNKEVKIATNIKHHWEMLEFDPDTSDEYMTQVTDWMEGSEPNDAPDSLSSLLAQHYPIKLNNLHMYSK